MTPTQARDLLVKLLAEQKYEQENLGDAVPPGERIAYIDAAGLGVAVTFADGTRVLYAVITEGGQQ